MTKALIIGAGIGGAATAIALRKAGIDSVVYEAYPTGADDVGAFLTIMRNGMDALRAIDAHEAVIANSFPAASVELYSDTGKHLAHRSIADGDAEGARTLRRATLYRVLHDEVTARGGRIEHGKRLQAATSTPEGRVLASFTDGSRAEGDLLVGADGIHSVTRTIIDAGAPRPRYTGLNIVYGYTRDRSPRTAPDAYHMVFGKRAFFGYTTPPDGHTWWFARIPGPELTDAERRAATPEHWKQRALSVLMCDDTPAAEIVQATDDEIVGSNAYDIPSTPVWHTASMVLVGDAVHAASPAGAQGASMALEDSVVLAKCLRDLPDPGRAFRAYESLRRKRTEHLVAASADQGVSATAGPRPEGRPNPPEPDDGHHVDWDAPVAPE